MNFRIRIPILIILLMSFIISNAQEKKTRIGFKILPQYSYIPKIDNSGRLNLGFGILLNQKLNKKLFIETGLLYTSKTQSGQMSFPSLYTNTSIGSAKFIIRNNYLSLPITLQYRPNRFFIFGGLSFDYKYSGYLKFETTNEKIKSKEDYCQIGILGGIGYIFPIGSKQLSVELRFNPTVYTFSSGLSKGHDYTSIGLGINFLF